GATIVHDFTGVFENPTVDKCGEIGRAIVSAYVDPAQQLDGVYLVYNEFKSAINQEVVVEALVPITPRELDSDERGDFIYEPGRTALLERLLPMYIEVEVYRAVLE